ncbi:MAG: hypothetical protein LUG49_07560 [Oscillospiraceae bacterium]|nr:hypothetical protein [Oscillospiraceae bacterium]
MASLSFTRDEVILALDVLFSSGNKRVNADSPEMIELSRLLNRLPIHLKQQYGDSFRTNCGIAQQLNSFMRSKEKGCKVQNVGAMFYEVASEFDGRESELHQIAEAIRRNEEAYSSLFGSTPEGGRFPEEVLLEHLHRLIETRDGGKLPVKERCDVCGINLIQYYRPCGQILVNHLIVSPTEMDFEKKYRADDFITVCPTCHDVLHRFRPWVDKHNCEDILV